MSLTLGAFVFIFIGSSVVLADRSTRSADVVRATTIKESPYVSGEEGSLEGYIPDLMKKIGEKTGKTYELFLVKDGKYGSNADGSGWTGMIGEIVRNEAEIAAAPITISDTRKQAIDFTDPFMEFSLMLVMRKGAEDGLKTVEDLAAKDDIQYGVVQDGITESMFEKKAGEEAYGKLWRIMSKDENRVKTIAEGVERIRDESAPFAMFMEANTAKWWVGRKDCDLVSVDLKIPDKHQYGLAIKKGSALLGSLNNALRELKSEGELKKLSEKWWDEKSECSSADKASLSYPLIAIITLLSVIQSSKL